MKILGSVACMLAVQGFGLPISAAAQSAIAANASGETQINVTADRFEPGLVKVSSPDVSSFGAPALQWFGEIKGGKVMSVDMMLSVESADWRYLSCHMTDWLIDGKPSQLAQFKYGNHVISGEHVSETLFATLTSDQAKLLFGAHSIDYRICNDEFSLTPQQMKTMRRFVVELVKQAEAQQGHQ